MYEAMLKLPSLLWLYGSVIANSWLVWALISLMAMA